MDHVGDLTGQGFELPLNRFFVLNEGVLGVIHAFEAFPNADEVVGDAGQAGGVGVRVEAMIGIPAVWRR